MNRASSQKGQLKISKTEWFYRPQLIAALLLGFCLFLIISWSRLNQKEYSFSLRQNHLSNWELSLNSRNESIVNRENAQQKKQLKFYVHITSRDFFVDEAEFTRHVLDKSRHWYKTPWVFANFWLNIQLKRSLHRTYDPQEADFIYISQRLFYDDAAGFTYFFEELQNELPYLDEKPHIASIETVWYYYVDKFFASNWTRLYESPIFKKVTFFGFEKHWENNQVKGEIIPYPFLTLLRGDQGMEKNPFNWGEIQQTKKRLISFAGLMRFKERELLKKECLQYPEQCKFIPWVGTDKNMIEIMDNIKQSWFVLSPRSDFLTRSTMYDGLLQNTLVVYHVPHVTESMPFQDTIDWNKLFILDDRLVKEPFKMQPNIVDLIHKQVKNSTKERFEYLHKVRQVFQYSLNPDQTIINYNDRYKMHEREDALTYTMKSYLIYLCNKKLVSAEKCQLD